jgi:hypothetical protein
MTLVPDEHRFTGVSMRRRLARLLGAVAAMLVLALAVAVLALVQSRSLDARADGPYYRALVDGERASVALADADASVSAYRATCDEAALEPWTRAVGASGRIMLLADVERRALASDAEVLQAYEGPCAAPTPGSTSTPSPWSRPSRQHRPARWPAGWSC